MRVAALCLLVLIVGASATSLFEKYPLNFSSKRSIMTLLTQVEAKLKSGGPLDAITRLLEDFVTEVTEEQVQHDQLFASQQKECADEFGFRESEIQQANAALAEAQETLDGCNSQQVRAQQDLQTTRKQLAEDRNFLALIEDTRRREAYQFETSTNVYQTVTRAVDEALVILEEIWSGESSFAQLSKHMNSLLKSSVKVRKVHFLSGVMAAMSQLASKDLQADEALLEKVKTLLTNFREKVETAFREAAAVEEAAIAEYNEDKSRLTASISSLETQQEGLENELRQLEKCIITQTGIVQSATQKRDRNQRLLEDAQALCQSVADEYASASASRKEELELLAAIRERVQARFSELTEDVTARGVQDEFTYSNEYAYEQPAFAPSN